MERIKRIAEKAEKYDINVAMENLNNVENVGRVLNAIKSPKIGFCYDSCHHANYEHEVNLPGIYGDRLVALHLHDNGGEIGQHQLPFNGKIDWPDVMGKITSTGYKGATALEPMNWGYENLSIEEFLGKAYESATLLDNMRSVGK